MEEALHDVPLYRGFAKIGGAMSRLLDETTILRFRHLLGSTSRTISFADSPIWFLVFFALHAAITALVILVTVVMAELLFKRRRPR